MQGTPFKTTTPLKEYNIFGLESPLATLNTPCRELYALQESLISYTTPVRGSNLSSIEPRKLETSLSDLNVSMQELPKAGSQTLIEIQNKILITITLDDESLIDQINTELRFVKLKPSERLLSRLKKEISRSKNDYKRLTSGHTQKMMLRKERYIFKKVKWYLLCQIFQSLNPKPYVANV